MKTPKKNWLEWSIFAISLVVVLGTAGVLFYELFTLGEQPADPQMELGPPQAHTGYYAVPVTVRNRGNETAQNVHLAVTLQLSGEESERADFILDYLPRFAKREAWVTFLHDPAKGKLEPRVLGYEKP